jgi:hypothetical protein
MARANNMRAHIAGYLFFALFIAVLAGIQQGSNAGSFAATDIYHMLKYWWNPVVFFPKLFGILVMWNGGTLWQGAWIWVYVVIVVITLVGFIGETLSNLLSGVANLIGIK